MNGQGHLRGRTLQRRCEGVAAALQSRSSFRGHVPATPAQAPAGAGGQAGRTLRRAAGSASPATAGSSREPDRGQPASAASEEVRRGLAPARNPSIDLRLPVGAGMRRGTDSGGEGPLPHCPGPPVASRSTPSRVLSGKAISYADAHRGASDRIAVEEGFGQPDTGEPQAPQLEGAPRLRDLPVFGYTP